LILARSSVMRIVLSSAGRFHAYNLARQLKNHGYLEKFFTSYPFWKIDPDLRDKTVSFPWVLTPSMALQRWGLIKWARKLDKLTLDIQDRWVANQLPDCDIVVALAQNGLQTFRVAKLRGIKTICDRGSSHILYQNELLK